LAKYCVKQQGAIGRQVLDWNRQGARKRVDQKQPGNSDRKGTAEGWKKLARGKRQAIDRNY
jgi:hypothetical protein